MAMMNDEKIILKTFRKLMDANALIKKDGYMYTIEYKTRNFNIHFTLHAYPIWLEESIDHYWSATRVESKVIVERGVSTKVYRHIVADPLELMDEEIKKMFFEIEAKCAEQRERQEEELEMYMRCWLNE